VLDEGPYPSTERETSIGGEVRNLENFWLVFG